MLVILVLLHCYNKLNEYHDIDNNCGVSVDYYRSTKIQYAVNVMDVCGLSNKAYHEYLLDAFLAVYFY